MIMVAEKLFELEKKSFNVSIYLIQCRNTLYV